TKKSYSPNAETNTGKPGAIFKIFSDSRNIVWFGGWNSGLQKLNPVTSSFEHAPLLPDSLADILKAGDVRGIAEDGDGNIWVSYHGTGIGRYNPETFQMELFRHNPHDLEGSLANNWTYNLCTDKNNNLWIATTYGVSRLNLRDLTFENYFYQEN